jgi:predicted RNA-binding Zn ribbon-like protein
MERPPAPGGLELVRQFVNTRDAEAGTDDIGSPAEARRWLVAAALIARSVRVTAADLDRIVEVRESLRALLLANNGDPVPADAVERLNKAARRAGLSVQLGGAGVRLVPLTGGVGAAIAALLGAMYTAMAEGTWSRLKACRDDECQWAFYDHSKNHSASWCSMESCGNRNKARAYRSRQG